MRKQVILGFDTSNYTTSCAVCDINGTILANYKLLLPVKEGERGLRQSDAVFAHIKNLQKIALQIKNDHSDYDIVSIGYSAYPRDAEGSYMPCFLVGESVSMIISALYNIDAYKFSHQNGHIEASLYSSGANISGDFIAFHVSGGTTEIVYVNNCDNEHKISIIGGSSDLHFGQAIDRIGVKMGLPFPSGRYIETLANENTKEIPNSKICVNGYSCNISGLENLSLKLYERTEDKALTSAFVLDFISKTLISLTKNLRKKYNTPIVYAGGVMSNKIIQNNLKNTFKDVYFAEPEFSSDNASGVALLALKKYKRS